MTRGRKPLTVPTVALNVALPEDWRTRLDLLLFSEFEGRVPKGAYQRFFLERLVDYFDTKPLDLAPYIGSLPGERVVRGHPLTIEALKAALEKANGAVA